MLLVLGGARSGKSTYAEKRAYGLQKELKTEVAYIATAIAFDKDMKERITKHQNTRPKSWHTIEQYKMFENLVGNIAFQKSEVILVDCVTLMVSNLLLEKEVDFDHVEWPVINEIEKMICKEVLDLVQVCKKYNKNLIMVSNEVGLGIVPAYRLGSIFRDIAGRINQMLAKEADEVYLLTAGIEMALKK